MIFDNTDNMIDHYVATVRTQAGIQKYAEAMAQVLAEAGQASHKATGDNPATAVNKWIEVIRKRAIELLKQEELEKNAPVLTKLLAMEKLIEGEVEK